MNIIKFVSDREKGSSNVLKHITAKDELRLLKNSCSILGCELQRRMSFAINIIFPSESNNHEKIWITLAKFNTIEETEKKFFLWSNDNSLIAGVFEIEPNASEKTTYKHVLTTIIFKEIEKYPKKSVCLIEEDMQYNNNATINSILRLHTNIYRVLFPQHSKCFTAIDDAKLIFSLKIDELSWQLRAKRKTQ